MRSHKYMILGMAIGLIITSLVWLTVFSISNNPAFIPLMGSGLVIGLAIGWYFDEYKKKKKES